MAGIASRSLNRRLLEIQTSNDWDLAAMGSSYAAILAPLAAFSVASSVFLANLTRVAGSRQFEDIMALFLIAFILQMGSALVFATVRSALPSSPNEGEPAIARRVMHVSANLGFYLALNTSWLGLRPLLIAIGLPTLAGVFSWILLFAILSGASRQGAWITSLLGASTLCGYLIPVVALGFAAIYRLGVVNLVPALWPERPTLALATVVFVLSSLIFSLETNMIRLHGKSGPTAALARVGPKVLPGIITASATALILLWFSVVMGRPG